MPIQQSQIAIDIAWFRKCLENKQLIQTLKAIKLVISDVDGTLTNTEIYVSEEGEGGRQFSVQDGYIVSHVRKAGIEIALMSGKDNKSTFERGKKLGIPDELCVVGLATKPESVRIIQQKLHVSSEQTLFFGDDYLDAQVKLADSALLYCSPSNAPFYLHPVANLVVPRDGGNSAFRLLMDLLLYVQGVHFAQNLITQSLK